MSFPFAPPKGVTIIKLVGPNLGALMYLGVLKILVMSPWLEVSILPNKEDILCLTLINLRWDDMLSIPIKQVQISNKGCILI